MKKKYILGAFVNFTFLGGYIFLYEMILREAVVRVRWLPHLGSFWFFTILALLVPIVLFKKGKQEMAMGALWSVTIGYCLICAYIILQSA